MKNIVLAIVALLLGLGSINAAEPITPAETPPEPAFNRLSDFDEITALLKGYAAAYPEWVKLESIGQSTEGRDMWLLTLNNPATGDVLSKPAMYVDGNTHGNEIQGTEATLYTIDFLLKNYGRLERVTELLDRASFYFVPVVNPDGRADWFAAPATANYPRTVKTPVDDDRDGLVDEDGYDDLDGDGVITQMRMKVPLGQGTHRLHPKDSRILVPLEKDEQGDYIELIRRSEPQLGLRLAASLRSEWSASIPAEHSGDPKHCRLGPHRAQHRGRPDLSQLRRDDSADTWGQDPSPPPAC
jgi:hypothetical protein